MPLGPDGYLLEFLSWDHALALRLAEQDQLKLTDAHWEILHFLREYYQNFEMAPPIRLLTKAVAMKLGQNKGNSLYLYQLFPDGPAKQACRYAGLPKPVSCI